MKLLFTGASGFLGVSILPILQEKYLVDTIGITTKDEIACDLSVEVPILTQKYDIILHAAGKAHSTPRTEAEKKLFYDVNYNGTINLCTALEKSGLPRYFIFVSTVAVYGVDSGENFTEEHPLNGVTPYALSKIKAENFLIEWCKKYDIVLTILRPALFAGKNPPGNLGAMIHGIKSGSYLSIGKSETSKSMLMVDDICEVVNKIYAIGGIYNLCDNHHPTFRELEVVICKQLEKKMPISIPLWLAKAFAKIGNLLGDKFPINDIKLDKIVKPLTFSNEKIKKVIDWTPLDVIEHFKIN